jgi:hypothetical protein
VTLGKGAPLLPRRITSKNLAFRTAELIGHGCESSSMYGLSAGSPRVPPTGANEKRGIDG